MCSGNAGFGVKREKKKKIKGLDVVYERPFMELFAKEAAQPRLLLQQKFCWRFASTTITRFDSWKLTGTNAVFEDLRKSVRCHRSPVGLPQGCPDRWRRPIQTN
jgi:hypothetical protein